MIIEANIVAKHNLNISSMEALANDLASRLSLNIEFGNYDFKNDNFIVLGSSTNTPGAPFFKLFPENSSFPNEVSFILELGDGAQKIFKEIINLTLPYPLAYNDLYEEHLDNPKGLLSKGILNDWLEELLKLGADKIYFIEDYNSDQSGLNYNDEKNYTWEEFTGVVHKHMNHFIEPKNQ